MSKLLKASPIVKDLKKHLTQEVQELRTKGVIPTLRVILVGNHKPSLIYTANKKKLVNSLGADCEIIHLSEDIEEKEFLNQVKKITSDPLVHGAFIQLPVPDHLAHLNLSELIPHKKDIDGFHAYNLYGILQKGTRSEGLIPCTPLGITTLLKRNDIELSGKSVVVIGRSMIVGKPMGLLALNSDATVTYCHSKTQHLENYTKHADIIISAVGKPRFLTRDYLNQEKKQVLIDVGINHDQSGKICGDLDFENIKDHCQAITPVPGGVGPMTIISLAQNLIKATKNQTKDKEK